MEKQWLEMIISQGAFAILFVWLFIDTRKENKEREEKYQAIITKLSDKLVVIEDMNTDIKEIKSKLDNKKEEI